MIWAADHSPAAGFIDLCIVFNFDLVHMSDKAKCKHHPVHLLFLPPSDSALSFPLSPPPFHFSLTLLTLVTHINIWFGSWLSKMGKSAVPMHHFVCICEFRVCICTCVCVPVKHSYVHQIRTQGLRLTGDTVYSCLREASCQAAWSYNSPEHRRSVERPVHCTTDLNFSPNVWL